jgi:hypothetical protein
MTKKQFMQNASILNVLCRYSGKQQTMFCKGDRRSLKMRALLSVSTLFKISTAYLLCMIFSINSFAQKPVDSSKVKDTIPVFAVILSQPELMNLIQLLKSADEKPSVINTELNLIYGRIQLVSNPVQNLPAKTSGKK